jgi:hypothetical protein
VRQACAKAAGGRIRNIHLQMPLTCNMDSTRPKQAIRKPTKYLDSPSQIAPVVEAVAKKANYVAAKSALKPVAADPLFNP